MWWIYFLTISTCLLHAVKGIALRQCSGQGIVSVTENEPYNLTCRHSSTTRHVTWLFTSLVDTPTDYVITKDCVLLSKSSGTYCHSLLPTFQVTRPSYAYTGLKVDWGQVSEPFVYGVVSCFLDGVQSGSCFLHLLKKATAATTTPPTATPTSITGGETSTTAPPQTSTASSETTAPTTTAAAIVSSRASPTVKPEASTPSTPRTASTTAAEPATATSLSLWSNSADDERVPMAVIIASSVSVVTVVPVIVVGVFVFCVWWRKKRRSEPMSKDGDLNYHNTVYTTFRSYPTLPHRYHTSYLPAHTLTRATLAATHTPPSLGAGSQDAESLADILHTSFNGARKPCLILANGAQDRLRVLSPGSAMTEADSQSPGTFGNNRASGTQSRTGTARDADTADGGLRTRRNTQSNDNDPDNFHPTDTYYLRSNTTTLKMDADHGSLSRCAHTDTPSRDKDTEDTGRLSPAYTIL